jgi:hypothetical protein
MYNGISYEINKNGFCWLWNTYINVRKKYNSTLVAINVVLLGVQKYKRYGHKQEIQVKQIFNNPRKSISTIKFKDISNTLSSGYKRMFALSTTGEIYLWGKDTNIADMTTSSCSVTWEGVSFNLCQGQE